jgi:hypothetical protein
LRAKRKERGGEGWACWAAWKRGEGEKGKKIFSFLKNSFQIIFILSNFNQTRNHAFDS